MRSMFFPSLLFLAGPTLQTHAVREIPVGPKAPAHIWSGPKPYDAVSRHLPRHGEDGENKECTL